MNRSTGMRETCNNCHKVVPERCDGLIWYIKEWGPDRPICAGTDGGSIHGSRFHFVMGHGASWYTPLLSREECEEAKKREWVARCERCGADHDSRTSKWVPKGGNEWERVCLECYKKLKEIRESVEKMCEPLGGPLNESPHGDGGGPRGNLV